jgi:hypothetical protein
MSRLRTEDAVRYELPFEQVHRTFLGPKVPMSRCVTKVYLDLYQEVVSV